MKENTKTWLTIIGFIVWIALLSAIDLGLNLVSLIPGVGDVVKTLSETVIEIIQISSAALGLIVVAFARKR